MNDTWTHIQLKGGGNEELNVELDPKDKSIGLHISEGYCLDQAELWLTPQETLKLYRLLKMLIEGA